MPVCCVHHCITHAQAASARTRGPSKVCAARQASPVVDVSDSAPRRVVRRRRAASYRMAPHRCVALSAPLCVSADARRPHLIRASSALSVLDEGHCLRERSTKQSKACVRLLSRNRWILTGTPMSAKMARRRPASPQRARAGLPPSAGRPSRPVRVLAGPRVDGSRVRRDPLLRGGALTQRPAGSGRWTPAPGACRAEWAGDGCGSWVCTGADARTAAG